MEQDKKCVVYKLINTINNDFYIGVSTRYTQRMKEHKCSAKAKLKDAIEKFGWESFESIILFQNDDIDWCFTKEIELINELNPAYNTTAGGGSTKLREYNLDLIKQIREETIDSADTFGVIAKNLKDKYNINMSATNVGYILTGKSYVDAGGPIRSVASNHRGENNAKALLTNKEAKDIRIELNRTGESAESYSKKCVLNMPALCNLLTGKSYKDAGGPLRKNMESISGENSVYAKLSLKDVIEIRTRGYMTKETYPVIAKDYPVGRHSIGDIIRGKSWKNAEGPILGKDYMKRGEGSG